MKISFKTFPLLRNFFTALFAILLIAGCSKGKKDEDQIISPDPAEPLATFSLEPGPVICQDSARRYPVYPVGIAVSGDNKSEFNLRVTKTGSWSFSTDTINGLYYSGKGVFTDTGMAKIQLRSYGKPVLPGSLYLRLRKDSVVRLISIAILDTNAINTEPVPSKPYFMGKLGNDSIFINGQETRIPSYSGKYDTLDGNGIVSGDEPFGLNQLHIRKARMYNYIGSTLTDFKAFFKAGCYPLVLGLCFEQGQEGMSVFYLDKNAHTWWSVGHLENQIGSSFMILGVEEGRNSGGEYVRIKARFSCRMRKSSTGEFKILTGESVCYFYRPPS